MGDVFRELAGRQDGVVAAWQLRAGGKTRAAVRHRTRALREVQDGVFVEGHAPITLQQR